MLCIDIKLANVLLSDTINNLNDPNVFARSQIV
jgi:hypothetical protein